MPSSAKDTIQPAETVSRKKYTPPLLRRLGQVSDVTLENNRGRQSDGAFVRRGGPGGGWPPWGSL